MSDIHDFDDYEAPTSCGQCGEQISHSSMNAGFYVTRDNHETILHVGDCAEAFDKENPGRQLEDDKPGEQWPAEPVGMIQDRKAEWYGWAF